MLILEPVIHQTIWGGDKLRRFHGKNEKTGHLYLINGHVENTTRILNGKHQGENLYEYFSDPFPLTVALVDASDDLSIQVHPDGRTADLLEGERVGKTESWIFLDAPASGWIYGGCACTDYDKIEWNVKNHHMDQITEHFPVGQMDCVTVEAGTLHAMTAGSMVYEVEYGSDFTYRFYDYDRCDENGKKRELHIEKALRSIIPDRCPKKHPCLFNTWMDEGPYEILFLKNGSFEKYTNCSGRYETVAILDGEGKEDGVAYGPGMGIILFPGESVSGIREAVISRLTVQGDEGGHHAG